MSNHDKSGAGSGAGTNQDGVVVIVPADGTTGPKVDGLEYLERKHWKYRTKHEFEADLEGYDIKICSSKCSEPEPDITSFITLKVASAGNGCKKRPVSGIVIKKGYAWDGASGPTFDTRASFKASLVHDAFYQCMRLRYVTQDSRGEVDRLFRHMLGGMGPLRRGLWYWAVRLFGKKAATPEPDRPEGATPEPDRRRIPAAIVALPGIFWLVHWACSKCWPTKTADLLDCLSEFLGATWTNWLGALLESGLAVLGILALVYLVAELVGWTLRPCGRKQKGRKHPGIVALTVGIGVIERLVSWLPRFWLECCPAQTEGAGEAIALLGAGMLLGLGYELWKGDS